MGTCGACNRNCSHLPGSRHISSCLAALWWGQAGTWAFT